MNLKNFTLLLPAVFYLAASGLSQASLTVADPQSWWSTPRKGSIDEASITVRPKGIYMEVGLFLTFSAQGTTFHSGDTVEVVLDFDLPEDAIVIDSWLWIDEVIVKADLIDRWSATQIYEEIVNRRQDPSVLYKDGSGRYQLRVFPMDGGQSRRVKITYLAPTRWKGNNVWIDLPLDILSASNIPLPEAEIRVWPGVEWSNPRLREAPEVEFFEIPNPDVGTFWIADIPQDIIQVGADLILEAPFQNGIYVNRFEDSKIYQLAFLPSQVFGLEPSQPKRTVFVLDHDYWNTDNLSKEQILNKLRNTLISDFSGNDYFNLIISNSEPLVNPEWIPGDEQTIEQVFSSLPPDPMGNTSDLHSKLSRAIQFIQLNGGEGNIVVISNSQNEGDPWAGNYVIEDLLDQMGDAVIPVHIVDYQNTNFYYFWFGWDWDSYWMGNDYFYTNLSQLTGGNYPKNGSFGYRLGEVSRELDVFLGTIDLYATLENGFCHSRFNLGNNGINMALNRPMLQVGKYEGEFPMAVLAGGIYDGQIFSGNFTIGEELVHQADTTSEEIWAGNYIKYLEGLSQSNSNIAHIIDVSKQERVLSLYTAFICLEPNLGGEPCLSCFDDTDDEILIQTNEEEAGAAIIVKAFPNPFREQIQFRIELPDNPAPGRYRLSVFNTLGQLVKALEFQDLLSQGEVVLQWDGRDEAGRLLPSGVYFAIVDTPHGQVRVKVAFLGQ